MVKDRSSCMLNQAILSSASQYVFCIIKRLALTNLNGKLNEVNIPIFVIRKLTNDYILPSNC